MAEAAEDPQPATFAERILGKSRAELAEILANARRQELLDLLHRFVTYERKLTPEEFATANRLPNTRSVIALIKAGKLHATQPVENRYRIPLSSAREFDERAAVTPKR